MTQAILRKLGDLPEGFAIENLFGRSAPLEIEIGVGKGRFLKEYAQLHPDTNLLGIEKSAKWLKVAATRIQNSGVENVSLLLGYVDEILPYYIQDESVRAYHVYFPDPWPKKRHHKRRLFQDAFLHEVVRTLTPQGVLHIATDHMVYFDWILEYLEKFKRIDLKFEATQSGPIPTNYQVKYEKEGREMKFLRAWKG